jgi:hypothetical protein
MKSNIKYITFLLLINMMSCKKFVEIQPPSQSISTSQVFADSADAAAAVAGIYSTVGYSNVPSFLNGWLSDYAGFSADELLDFNYDPDVTGMVTNTVLNTNGWTSELWNQAYADIYLPNAIIGGLQASSTISQPVKNELIGESKWFRAFIDFYLVNLFGDLPLITTINYQSNALAPRVPAAQIYQAIISDLTDAQSLLPADYSEGDGERVRVNKWAATAMLARVYLYTDSFADAEMQATAVIGNASLYRLDTLNGVFLANNPEAILQWQNNSSVNNYSYNATTEGYNIIPFDSTSQPPFCYLSPELLNGFETGDLRKTAWLDSTDYSGTIYYYPYKYKVGFAQAAPNAPVTEYYTVLRLAEQYLIRAEARAQQNKLSEAISDLNIIRTRAGLANLSPSLNQLQVLAAVAQERRVELFAEWGHRWLDLKRTGQVGAAFSTINYKSGYKPFQQLYPIPSYELQTDPNLKQNPGY